MTIVFAVLAIGGHGFSTGPLLLIPIAIACLFMFSLGLAVLLAAADVYLRDVQYLINVLLMMWIWITPIMYVPDSIDSAIFNLILDINPMTYIIELFQDVLYWKIIPSFEIIMISAIESIVMIVIGFWIYQKASADFAEVL